MAARDPFLSSVNVQERLQALKQFTVADCKAALKLEFIQPTVKAAVERRLDRMVEHHHRRKAKGKKS